MPTKTTVLWALGGVLVGYVFSRTLSRLPVFSSITRY